MRERDGEHGQVAEAGRGGEGEKTWTVGAVIGPGAEMGHGGGGEDGDGTGPEPFRGALGEAPPIEKELGPVGWGHPAAGFQTLPDGFTEGLGLGETGAAVDIPGFGSLERSEQGKRVIPAGTGLM